MNKRMDVVTRKKFDSRELIRISILKNGETLIDKNFNLEGRGIYIHKLSIEKGLKTKILERNLKKFNGSFELIKEELEVIMNVKKE